MGTLKFGLIGCGRIADANHIPEMLTLGKKAVITAMYDTVKGKAQALAKKHNLTPEPEYCRTLDELLASDIDAVMIATPNSLHYPQTIRALEAGKHVLVEKPMASSMKEAEEMIALAEEKGLVLQVNQSLRYSSLHAEIAGMIAKGKIGTPLHANCIRCSTNSPDVSWSPGATWFVQKKYKGSLVTDIAVHMADVLFWCFGPVSRITAVTRNLTHEVPDNVDAIMQFENGATASLTLSWTYPEGAGVLEFYGDKGSLKLTSNGIELLKKGEKEPVITAGKDVRQIPNSHAAFVAAVNKGKKGEWLYGRNALALCMGILESAKKHKGVAPDLLLK